MERLTLEEAIKHEKEVADMNYNDAEKFDSNDSVENYMKANCMECAEQHEKLAEWLEELKSYKEAEEQDLLVRLPCPIGTTVYDICGTDIHKNVVDGIEYGENGHYFLWSDKGGWLGVFNDLVFLTREEAEKKLEEMRNDNK